MRGVPGDRHPYRDNISVSRVSNLLIMLSIMAGFDPAIRRFESFHPSYTCLPSFFSGFFLMGQWVSDRPRNAYEGGSGSTS
jgi:hypothetical protein